MPDFVHLHNHSDYSLLDAAQKVTTMVTHCKELGMDSIALTEHGNMFSAVLFHDTAKANGIKPIIGCEVYVAYGDRSDRTPRKKGEGAAYHHLVLLVKNFEGYKNLMKLTSLGFQEGFYYKPRVDKESLRKYSEGLIALSACLKGEVAEKAWKHGYEDAVAAAKDLESIYPGNFYLEMHNHGIPEEKIVRDMFPKISEETGIPMVVTNDAHYNKQEHAESHDILFCLGNGKDYDDPNRQRYHGDSFYIKSPDEMHELFADYPEAIANTRKIADLCDVDIPKGDYHLPVFPIPKDFDSDDEDLYLKTLAQKGLQKIFGNNISSEYQERLDFELGVIKNMGFPGYFLIVQDFVQYAKNKGIPVGPGRGSAAGSLVAYALGITNIDPLIYNLLFERFLNPERISMPDIDIDFCYERRIEVIDYIKNFYGHDSVCQIITFGQMKAKNALRDVSRVLGLSYGEGDRIAKMIPADDPKMTLAKAIDMVPELKELIKNDERYKNVWKHALVLEGMNRHSGIHAAGVVITPGPLTNYIPVYQNTKGDVTTQYDMNILDRVGILKVDFLGLRTLTVIQHALDMLKARNIEIDINTISLEDESTYKLFMDGTTHGIFQFESGGMREYLKQLKPNKIGDLVAMNALYRPGPMGNIPSFIARKHGDEKIEYLHASLEPILEDTYGIIVYQEQVMQIAHLVAGFTLGEADKLRRAMGKKKIKEMEEMQPKFVAGAGEKGVSEKIAIEIYELIYKFAAYGFNKSHSVAYAYIAYQTAWLKAHYPAEFMAAYLTSERTDLKRVVELVSECRRMGIEVKHPDVNLSNSLFTADGNSIIFGMSALKHMGEKAAEEIQRERKENGEYKSLFDLASRVDLHQLNRKAFEALIYAGAMDSLPGNRNQKLSAVDISLQYGQKLHSEKNNAQVDLFGGTGGSTVISEPVLEDLPDWDAGQKLNGEKEFIGFYLSGHPAEIYQEELDAFSTLIKTNDKTKNTQLPVRVGGVIGGLKKLYDKKNRPWTRFILNTLSGEIQVLAFSKSYAKYQELLIEEAKVFIEGKFSDRDSDNETPTIIFDSVMPLDDLRLKKAKRVHIRFIKKDMSDLQVQQTKEILERNPGEMILIIHIYSQEKNEIRVRAGNIRVNVSQAHMEKLRTKLGHENVWFD